LQSLIQIETGDRLLLDDISRTMAEAARKSGDWLVCRLGCTQCCIGPFAITQLDGIRLRRGLEVLSQSDPERATRVQARAEAYIADTASVYPGDPVTGELWDENELPASMDEMPCPALDPETGHCDLYEFRPITCRAFGPVTRIDDDACGACELCYVGATDEEKAACAVEIDPEGLESELLAALDQAGIRGATIVAYALRPGFHTNFPTR
jgi:Fe-S-cluster containining protein